LRRFQLHLVDTGAGPVTLNATITGLKFFFDITLGRPELMLKMTHVAVPRKLPVILSPEEVGRLIAAAPNLKHQAAMSVAYGAGLRVSEVDSLKVGDIDGERMTLRVEQGKGRKDRYAMLRLARAKLSSVRLAERARIVLRAAQGLQNLQIAQELGVDRITAGRWRQRYIESGLSGIERDLPRGAPPVKVDVAKLVELTTQTQPEAATHWSTRKMAAVLKVSPSTLMRHWQASGLKPHWCKP
jgi:integrase